MFLVNPEAASPNFARKIFTSSRLLVSLEAVMSRRAMLLFVGRSIAWRDKEQLQGKLPD